MPSFVDYFKALQEGGKGLEEEQQIHSCPELMDCIQQVGFLPLLDSGISGFAAESLLAEECQFT